LLNIADILDLEKVWTLKQQIRYFLELNPNVALTS